MNFLIKAILFVFGMIILVILLYLLFGLISLMTNGFQPSGPMAAILCIAIIAFLIVGILYLLD